MTNGSPGSSLSAKRRCFLRGASLIVMGSAGSMMSQRTARGAPGTTVEQVNTPCATEHLSEYQRLHQLIMHRLTDHFSPEILGSLCDSEYTVEASADELTRDAFGHGAKAVSHWNTQQIDAVFKRAITRDLQTGRFAEYNGWCLATTEALVLQLNRQLHLTLSLHRQIR